MSAPKLSDYALYQLAQHPYHIELPTLVTLARELRDLRAQLTSYTDACRTLTAERDQLRAQAWDEGAEYALESTDADCDRIYASNPYRSKP